MYSGYPFAFTANFIWHVGPMTFDLWGTDGTGTFTFQTNLTLVAPARWRHARPRPIRARSQRVRS